MSKFSKMSYLESSTPATGFSNRYHRQANVDGKSKKDAALVKHLHMSLYPFHSTISNSSFSNQQPVRVEKAFARGTFVTGDAGTSSNWGFFAATPIAAGSGIPNGFIIYSAGTAATNYNGFQNPTSINTTTGSLANTAFGTQIVNSRIISCGIRVRNVTTLLNRGGTLYALRSPNDETFVSGTDFNTQIAFADTTGNSWRCSTDGSKWEYIAWAPRDSDQMEFASSYVGLTPRAASMGGPVIAFVAQSPTGVPQTYEFEYVCIYELLSHTSSVIQGSTRGTAHPQTEEALQAVYELAKRPEVASNECSRRLAPFVADCVAAGHDVETIVAAGSDLVTRTVAALPSIYSSLKALGSWL